MRFLPKTDFIDSKTEKAKYNSNSGQALLVILISMAAVLTMVLSISSRTISEIENVTYEEDAARAFSAAEAGVEEALLRGLVGPYGNSNLDGNNTVGFDVNVTTDSTDDRFNNPRAIKAGESVTFWFVSHDGDDLFCGECLLSKHIKRLCWGDPNATYDASNVAPAVEVSVYYDSNPPLAIGGNFRDVKVARMAFDPISARRSNNKFKATNGGTCDIGDKTYPFRVNNLSFSSAVNDFAIGDCARDDAGCLLLAKVRVLYSNEPQKVGMVVHTQPAPASVMPAQGLTIESTGAANESTRKVRVLQTFPEPPGVVDATLFSNGPINKN